MTAPDDSRVWLTQQNQLVIRSDFEIAPGETVTLRCPRMTGYCRAEVVPGVDRSGPGLVVKRRG